MPRRFLIVGSKARASEDFILDDLPGTSGRLDVLARCVRAALLTSHGLRSGVLVYLLLLGGPLAPRVIRIDARDVHFLRPDERSLAVLLRKILSRRDDTKTPGTFVSFRAGIAIASSDVTGVLADAPEARVVILEEGAPDLRAAALDAEDLLFVIGDHVGLPDDVRARLEAVPGASRVSVGPVSIHADDVVAIVANELDRR